MFAVRSPWDFLLLLYITESKGTPQPVLCISCNCTQKIETYWSILQCITFSLLVLWNSWVSAVSFSNCQTCLQSHSIQQEDFFHFSTLWYLCLISLVDLFTFSYIKQEIQFCRIFLKLIHLKGQLFRCFFFRCILLYMQVLQDWWWDLTNILPSEEFFFLLGLGAKGLTALSVYMSLLLFFWNTCKVFQFWCEFNITFLKKLFWIYSRNNWSGFT